ncbi:hypothetical protein EES43_20200 [Streptomyces sp. ADI96-02]|nr:hypothetical protein EES43_20200 [Streptomyces sp. ADI96-02]
MSPRGEPCCESASCGRGEGCHQPPGDALNGQVDTTATEFKGGAGWRVLGVVRHGSMRAHETAIPYAHGHSSPAKDAKDHLGHSPGPESSASPRREPRREPATGGRGESCHEPSGDALNGQVQSPAAEFECWRAGIAARFGLHRTSTADDKLTISLPHGVSNSRSEMPHAPTTPPPVLCPRVPRADPPWVVAARSTPGKRTRTVPRVVEPFTQRGGSASGAHTCTRTRGACFAVSRRTSRTITPCRAAS